MRVLIVNADDLGASPAIDEGIFEAHVGGIVTSASLMVGEPGAAAAASRARSLGGLSVGLHVTLAPAIAPRAGGEDDGARAELRRVIERQYARFMMLVGRPPTHIDSHHDAHRHPALLAPFLELSRTWGLPLRGHSPARCLSTFYGQWGGVSHPEHVGVDHLLRMLEHEIPDGITELSCHPGRPDPRSTSGYSLERAVELRTLCDPRIRAAIATHGITLASYLDLPRLTARLAAG